MLSSFLIVALISWWWAVIVNVVLPDLCSIESAFGEDLSGIDLASGEDLSGIEPASGEDESVEHESRIQSGSGAGMFRVIFTDLIWIFLSFWRCSFPELDFLVIKTLCSNKAVRLCCSKLNPDCLCYDSKRAKLHNAGWAIQLLNHLLKLPNRASSCHYQERSCAVTFILNFFPYRIVNLLNTSSLFTEL